VVARNVNNQEDRNIYSPPFDVDAAERRQLADAAVAGARSVEAQGRLAHLWDQTLAGLHATAGLASRRPFTFADLIRCAISCVSVTTSATTT
jgi:hypothetical protein